MKNGLKLIHETMHAFFLDFMANYTNLKKYTKIILIKSDFKLVKHIVKHMHHY